MVLSHLPWILASVLTYTRTITNVKKNGWFITFVCGRFLCQEVMKTNVLKSPFPLQFVNRLWLPALQGVQLRESMLLRHFRSSE